MKTVPLEELGDGVTHAILVEWLVGPGDRVSVGDAIVEVATDKANIEVTSPFNGVVRELIVDVDDEVKINAALCTIEESE